MSVIGAGLLIWNPPSWFENSKDEPNKYLENLLGLDILDSSSVDRADMDKQPYLGNRSDIVA